MNFSAQRSAGWLIALISLAAISTLFLVDPIPQPLSYHNFADTRSMFGLPNAGDVLSNLAFLIVGIQGIKALYYEQLRILPPLRHAYYLFFSAVCMVAFGSGYYHVWPDNHTLLWDRLPMAIGFMALFTIIIAEHINAQLARQLLWPLVLLGLSSVLYWYQSEQQGAGDLRLYALVQFLPMAIIPVVLLCFNAHFSGHRDYWLLLLCYLAAKLLEHHDVTIFDNLLVISGHTLKHLAAALGIYLLYRGYRTRLPAGYT